VISLTSSKTMQAGGWSIQEIAEGDVECVCVCPTTGEDRVWFSIMRGNGVRHIEYLAPWAFDEMVDANFVDSSVVTSALVADVVVETVSNEVESVATTTAHHGLLDDQFVRFENTTGIDSLNGRVFKVSDKTDHTFKLKYISGGYYDLSGEATGATGGTVSRVVNTMSGLTHLNGFDVTVLVDGSPVGTETVAAGAVTVGTYGKILRSGLPFTAICQPLDLPVTPNKEKRIVKLFTRFYLSSGCSAGPDETNTVDITFSTDEMVMDTPPTLVSQFLEVNFPGPRGFTPSLLFKSSYPIPLTILSCIVEYSE
jgi:hypothetical protein